MAARKSTGSSLNQRNQRWLRLLLPENKTARYETQDKPLFEKQIKADCPKCSVIYSNANQDPAKQQAQAGAPGRIGAITLDPSDPTGNTVYAGTGEGNASVLLLGESGAREVALPRDPGF